MHINAIKFYRISFLAISQGYVIAVVATLRIWPSEGTPIGGAHQVAQRQHIDRLKVILCTRGNQNKLRLNDSRWQEISTREYENKERSSSIHESWWIMVNCDELHRHVQHLNVHVLQICQSISNPTWVWMNDPKAHDGLQGRSLSCHGAKLGEDGLGTPPVQIKEEHDLTAQDQDLRNRNHSGHPMKYVNYAASEYSY